MTTDDDQLAKLAAIDDLDTNVEPCADCGGTGINPEHKQLDLDCEWCLGTGVIRTT